MFNLIGWVKGKLNFPEQETIKIREVNNITLTKIKLIKEKEKKIFFIPSNFKEYMGQEKIKNILDKYITNIKERNLPFPHTLIYSKPGMGKTTLARIIAKMLGKELVEVISSSIPKDKNVLQDIIKNLNGKILFIDEIHSLPKIEIEKIYSMMENFQHEGRSINPFTLIGATTELGEIIRTKKPFYDRFKLILELEDYSINQLTNISKQYRKEIFPNDNITFNHYKIIAENSRNTPRTVIRLTEATVYFEDDINDVLDNFEIIHKGYTQKDLRLLDYLSKNKVVGLQGIASYLDTSKENYLFEIEPFLIKNGVIIRTPKGRAISDYGQKIFKKLKGYISERSLSNVSINRKKIV